MSVAPAAQRADRLWLAALFLLAAAPYPWAMLVVDSGRDLAWAAAIADGSAAPLLGPGLNNLWHLGPAWFYLLALPLALGANIAGTALSVGLLAGAKVPVAYALGREAGDRALGLAFAASVALPGWSSFAHLVLLHTSVVEVAVLATLLLSLRAWLRPRAASAIGAAALLALAVHAHPTALTAAPSVALAVWRVLRVRGPAVLLGAPLAFGLPFAPMVWAEAQAGWPQWHATLAYAGDGDYAARLARAPALMRGLGWGSVEFVRDFLLGRWPAVAWSWTFGMLALGGVAAAGLLRRARSDRRVPLALALAALALLLVLLLRDSTPEWMTYALAPFGAALLALGLLGAAPQARRAQVASILAGFALLASGGVWLERLRVAQDGLQALPGAAIADVAQPPRDDHTPRFWLPAWGQDALARRLCAGPTPAALHGDLAAALHFGQGVAWRRHCTPGQVLRLGGAAPRAFAGVPRALARALGLTGEATSFGFLLRSQVVPLHPATGVPVRFHTRYVLDDYLPRLRAGRAARIVLQRDCAPGDWLVATNLLPLLNVPFVLRPSPDTAAAPHGRTLASEYHACPPQGRFDFELEVLDADAADIFVLPRDS